jgi:hypothetical protein
MTFTHQHQHMTLLRMAGVGLALFATILYAGRVHAEDYTRTFSVAERASVHIDTNDGSVSVTTGEAKQVEVRVEYQGYQLDKTLHIDASQQGDRITLTARTGFFSRGATDGCTSRCACRRMRTFRSRPAMGPCKPQRWPATSLSIRMTARSGPVTCRAASTCAAVTAASMWIP